MSTNARRREKYASDPAYRERLKADVKARRKRQTEARRKAHPKPPKSRFDKAWQNVRNAEARRRYAEDPVYREKRKAWSRERKRQEAQARKDRP